ncbi:MAG: exodeoxyribonuclease VII large subunit, partial [Deltaproteobacteria bacterium]|nr:exodeoxyribonuclease VII large subunit [Deltaproteobacteria bacterium]
MSHIYQVKELTLALKSLLEGEFPFVWVQGQLANFSRPSSGHLYFSLKDAESSLAAVWFKGNQQESENFDPLTGEVFENGPRPGLAGKLENGMELLCAGRLTVYPPRGSYQLVVELVQEAGKGQLQLQFELLKAELAKKGYFDPQRKKTLPSNPRRVAIITSPSGAA